MGVKELQASSPWQKQQVIVDTDISAGHRLRDVDDALALVHLLGSPEKVHVIGVTTVFGNASQKKTNTKAKDLMRVLGREDVPVLRGADFPWNLGKETEASRFLAEEVRSRPGQVTILGIGPLTNIATAVTRDNEFAQTVKRIVVVGGSVVKEKGLISPVPLEVNFFLAPNAARKTLGSGAPVTLIQDRLCRKVVFTEHELEAVQSMRNRTAIYLAPSIHHWFTVNRRMPFLPWSGGFVAWDVLGSAIILERNLFKGFEKLDITVKVRGWGRGRIYPGKEAGSSILVPSEVDRDGLMESLLESFQRVR